MKTEMLHMKMKKTIVNEKLTKHLLAALCAAAISMGAAAAPKLLVAGDSSTSDYDASKMPHRSWARALEKHMKPGVTIDNYARGGASTKSFLASGLWEKLVAAINLTNSRTVSDGVSMTEMLAKRDALKQKLSILRTFLDNASSTVDRYSRSEIVIQSTVSVAKLQKQVDALSKELRELDEKIQELNWTVELSE